MQDLYPLMFMRRSTRKYHANPLTTETLDRIEAIIAMLEPLHPAIETRFTIVHTSDAGGLFPIRAPHYVVMSSANEPGYLENIGYMGQQLDLHLSRMELGSCWVGMAQPTGPVRTQLPFVIALAFGTPSDTAHREPAGFRRKALGEISSGTDSRIEAARVAPSATNSQNWYFIAEKSAIHVYRAKLSMLKSLVYDKMNQIDIGIALCHLRVASDFEGIAFRYGPDPVAPTKQGYHYMGTVTSD